MTNSIAPIPVKVAEDTIVGRFNDTNIQTIIDKTAIAMDAAGVKKFEADIYADRKAVKGAIIVKINDHWSVEGGVIKNYSGPFDFEAHTRIKF